MEKYFDVAYIVTSIPLLLPYIEITFWITVIAAFWGTILGLLFAVAKLSPYQVLQKIAAAYTTALRCTPSIVLLFMSYYGIPLVLSIFNISLDAVDKSVFVLIAFSLQFSNNMCEAFRTAYEAVDPGQMEAAYTIGLTQLQAYWHIVFPQALVVALPNIENALISLIKEGALAYTIGLIDLTGKANLIIAGNYNSHALEVYLSLAFIYWMISLGVQKVFYRIAHIFSKGKRLLLS
jgi:L-cystine transport system permease protein